MPLTFNGKHDMQPTLLNKTIRQLLTASVAVMALLSGPVIIGTLMVMTSWEPAETHPLMLLLSDRVWYMFFLVVMALGCWVLPRFLAKEYLEKIFDMDLYKQVTLFFMVLALLLGLLLLPNWRIRQAILLLTIFVFLYFWVRMGFLFYLSPKVQAWNHPSTISTLFLSMMLTGIGVVIAIPQMGSTTLQIFLLLLLAAEVLILISRLKYLAKSNVVTSLTAKLYLKNNFLSLVLWIICGVIMPVMIILIGFFKNILDVRLIGPSLIIAQLIKIFLFFSTAFLDPENHWEKERTIA